MQELRRQAGWAKTFGLPLELVSPRRRRALPADVHRGRARRRLPPDGRLHRPEPAHVRPRRGRAAARRRDQHEHAGHGDRRRGRPRRRRRDRQGPIETEIVVNAGGMFAGEIGRLAGVNVPIIPMAHEYLVTRPSGIPLDIPTMRDPSLLVYFRGESGGLVMGGYERNPAPWGLDGIPEDFNGKLLPGGLGALRRAPDERVVRVPELEDAEVVSLVNGPEAFTPDGEFILGESDVRGFWVAAGFCAHGLAGAGGMGQLVAEWIVEGVPSLDVWEMDSRRFGPTTQPRVHARAHVRDLLDLLRHQVPGPGAARRAAAAAARHVPTRGCRSSAPPSARSRAGSARTGSSRTRRRGRGLRPRGWAGEIWSPAIGAEHRACREAAALFDETSFAKIEVVGPGAADFLERLCDNRVARDVGAITYTQMLNARGGIECDFTVTRLAEDRFRIVTGTAFGRHDLAWIRRHLPDDGSRARRGRHVALRLPRPLGPGRARDPPAAHRGRPRERRLPVHACAGDRGRAVPCLALRVTYVGELGWELYCPMEFGLRLWDTIWDAGRSTASSPAATRRSTRSGSRRATASGAPTSLRTRRRTRPASTSPSSSTRATSSGARRSRKPRTALERRLACLVLYDPRSVALGSEPVRVDGESSAA